MRKIPFDEQTIRFSLKFGQVIYNFNENQKSVQDVNGYVRFPRCRNKKYVYLSVNKIKSSSFSSKKLQNLLSRAEIIF